jgi:hypothetical protein
MAAALVRAVVLRESRARSNLQFSSATSMQRSRALRRRHRSERCEQCWIGIPDMERFRRPADTGPDIPVAEPAFALDESLVLKSTSRTRSPHFGRPMTFAPKKPDCAAENLLTTEAMLSRIDRRKVRSICFP